MNRIWALMVFAVYFPLAQAGEIEPYHAQTIQPYQAQTIQPHQAQTIEPYHAQTIQPDQAQTIPANAPLTPAQAAQREGQVVTVEFTVKSAGWNPSGYDELYSESSWQDPNAFFIRFPVSMRPQFNNSVSAYFGGQVVRVTGQVQTLNFGSMQRKVIYVTSANQVEKAAAGSQQAAAAAPATPPAPPAPPKSCVGRVVTAEEAAHCEFNPVTTVEFTVEGVGADYSANEMYSSKSKYDGNAFILSFSPDALASYRARGINPQKDFFGRKLRVVGELSNYYGSGKIDVLNPMQITVVNKGNEYPSVSAYNNFMDALRAHRITADGKPVKPAKQPTKAEIAAARKVQETIGQATQKIDNIYNQGLGKGVNSDTIRANGNMNAIIRNSY